MDLQKKLLCLAVSGGGIALMGAITIVLQMTKVIDLTHYFPTLSPEQESPAVQETASEPTPETAENSGSSKGKHTEAGDGKGSIAAPTTPTEIEIGTIGTVVGALTESPTENPGCIRTTVVKLSDSAMEWAQPGRQPKIGDRISLKIPPDEKRFVIQVVYFQERADGSGLDLYGRLEELGSTVIMMTVGNKFNLRITDRANNRIYYVSCIAGADEYVIEEWDIAKQPESEIPTHH